MAKLRAVFKDYQTFYEWRSDLEDSGYIVDSIVDNQKGEFILEIERSKATPNEIEDPGEPFVAIG
jgi:hypothetical protein